MTVEEQRQYEKLKEDIDKLSAAQDEMLRAIELLTEAVSELIKDQLEEDELRVRRML